MAHFQYHLFLHFALCTCTTTLEQLLEQRMKYYNYCGIIIRTTNERLPDGRGRPAALLYEGLTHVMNVHC